MHLVFDTYIGKDTYHVTVLFCVLAAVVWYTILSVSMTQAGPSG